MRFYFRAARLEREKRENKCSAKISTFTVSEYALININEEVKCIISSSIPTQPQPAYIDYWYQ